MAHLKTTVAVLFLALASTGCPSDGNSNSSSTDYDRPALNTGSDAFGSNASAQSADVIPRGTEVVLRGTGRQTYKLTHDGDIWISDRNKDTVVFYKRLFKGDEVIIDPNRDRIYVNGDTVSRESLKDNHTYAIHFLDERGSHHHSSNNNNKSSSGDKPSVLAGTRKVTSGRGELSHTFESSGTFYIYDPSAKRVVYFNDVKNRDHLSLIASENLITINRSQRSIKLDPDRNYELWYRNK